MSDLPEQVFGGVAELYDEVRPGYPQEMADDIAKWCDLPVTGRILEIGCGTGKATRVFAPLGNPMTCLDPSPGMLQVARNSCVDFPNVQFVESRLEDWDGPRAEYHLAFAAQAFHWIDPESGPPMVANALVDGGAFALFWHHQERPDSALRHELDRIYEQTVRGMRTPAPGVHDSRRWGDVIAESGLFTDLEKREYPRTEAYDADTWIKLLQTTSDHRSLPADTLEGLLSSIHDAIERHGGVYRFNAAVELVIARKK